MKFALAFALSLWASAGLAACPSYTFQLAITTADAPAASGSTTDAAGNMWNWSTGDFPQATSALNTLTLTPASCSTGGGDLSITHVYTLSSAGLAPDAGFKGCSEGAIVGTYNAVGDSSQRWTWDGSHLVGPKCVGLYMKDDGAGHAVLSATGDALTFTVAGVYPNLGFTIKDQRTSNYLQLVGTATGAPGAVGFGATQTVWMFGATHN